MSKGEEIAKNALSYVGQQEIAGNAGFQDPKFEIEMKEEGWRKGWAWCCVFAKVVFKNVYPEKSKELDRLFSPSCVQTFKNFRDAGYPVHALPRVGCLGLYQMMKDGVPQPTGHAVIVVELNSIWEYQSVEGNSNDDGGREGKEVAHQLNRKVLKDVWNGLKLLGFIQI